MVQLGEDLEVSLVSSNILDELKDGEPIEVAAANVRIRDFSGSN